MKTVYVHIGQSKTGTTAIQTALQNLQNQGILQAHNFNFLYIEHLINLTNKNMDQLLFNKCISQMQDFLKNSSANDCILSHENLSLPYIYTNIELIEHFFKLLSPYNVQILLYIRRQDILIESMWNQSYKHLTSTLEITHPKPYLFDCLKLYSSYVGKANINIRLFDKKTLYQQDSVNDFLEWINLKELIPLVDRSKITKNISLSPSNLRISRSYIKSHQLSIKDKQKRIEKLNQDLLTAKNDEKHNIFYDKLIAMQGINTTTDFANTLLSLYTLAKDETPRSHAYMPLDVRKQYLEKCKEETEYIAREYFGKEDGILFDNTMPEETVSLDSPSTDDLVKSFLPMLVHLKQRVDAVTNENKKLRERVQILEEQNNNNTYHLGNNPKQ